MFTNTLLMDSLWRTWLSKLRLLLPNDIDSISMVRDRPLQDVDGAWPVLVVVPGAQDASRLDGHHAHPKLAACHALEFRAKVNRSRQLHRNT